MSLINFAKIDTCAFAYMTNLYTLGKKDGRIELRQFKYQPDHIAALGMALDCAKVYDFEVYVECSFFTRYMLWKQEKLGRFKRLPRKWKNNTNWPPVDDIITYVEEANEAPGAFTEYYNEYM